MTPALSWASLLLRSARRDGLRSPWLWIGPLLVAQQIANLERRPWVVYLLPLFGMVLGNALTGRGVTPAGARISESPTLPVPVSARARVAGSLVAGTLVIGLITLTAFAVAQAAQELIDMAHGGPDTFVPDPVRSLRNAATCVLALLPVAALPAAAPLGRNVPWLEGIVLGFIGAGLYFDAPALLGNLSALAPLSLMLCATVVAVAPAIERKALHEVALPFRSAQVRAARDHHHRDVLGAPPRTPAAALLKLHLSTSLVTTLGLMLPLAGLSIIVVFLTGRSQSLPFALPMVLTLGAAAIPTLPLATGPAGVLGVDVRAAMWLPVRLGTLWWTSLVAACGQLGIALSIAIAGTAALTLAVPSVSAAEAVGRILASAPVCITAVLLLRAGLYLGPLMPVWARIVCLSAGVLAAVATPVDIGVPRNVHGELRLAVAIGLLVATMMALVALTPRRVHPA
jgi:hypothetical protein